MARLPIPGSDKGTWGDVLNDFLLAEHNSDGSLKSSGSLAAKQDTLVSGSNLKSINSTSLLGSGDINLTATSVGLGNVDNTADVTKNAAVVTLTNKTISGASNTLTNIPESAVTNLTTDLAGKVVGPATATDKSIARFSATTGKLIQDSVAKVDDTGNVITPGIADSNGNVVMAPLTNSSSGNYFQMQASNTAPTLQSAGSATNIDLIVSSKGTSKVIIKPGFNSNAAIDLATSSGLPVVRVDTANYRVGFGGVTVPSAYIHTAAHSTASAQIHLTPSDTVITTPLSGDVWRDVSRGISHRYNTVTQVVPGVTYIGPGNNLFNTTSEISLLTGGQGSRQLEPPVISGADFSIHYKMYKVTLRGTYSTAASSPGTLTFRIKLTNNGTTTTKTVVTPTLPSGVSDSGWSIELMVQTSVYYDGDANTYNSVLVGEINMFATSTSRSVYDATNGGLVTDYLGMTIDVSAQFSVASGSNIRSYSTVIEALN
jgi:hypothetical protein